MILNLITVAVSVW